MSNCLVWLFLLRILKIWPMFKNMGLLYRGQRKIRKIQSACIANDVQTRQGQRLHCSRNLKRASEVESNSRFSTPTVPSYIVMEIDTSQKALGERNGAAGACEFTKFRCSSPHSQFLLFDIAGIIDTFPEFHDICTDVADTEFYEIHSTRKICCRNNVQNAQYG